jgi:hypothetical protein
MSFDHRVHAGEVHWGAVFEFGGRPSPTYHVVHMNAVDDAAAAAVRRGPAGWLATSQQNQPPAEKWPSRGRRGGRRHRL